nr:integrase, catalytic region, zinc finger, CCHC-type, peptidase aspartic, catalytic [Tanacetum cinerariifolium]
MTKQERESMLYDEFDTFTSEPRKSIHSYYLRFAKLINDMNMIPMSITPMQINTKSANHLQPEWSSVDMVDKLQMVKLDTVFDDCCMKEVGCRCYKCKGEGHMAKQCTARKMVKDYEWFKDKMLLAQAQEAGIVLVEEQQDFLADSLEETNDCEDL